MFAYVKERAQNLFLKLRPIGFGWSTTSAGGFFLAVSTAEESRARDRAREPVSLRPADYHNLTMRLTSLPEAGVRIAVTALLGFQLQQQLLSKRSHLIVKRTVDIVGSLLGLIVLCVPLFFVGIAVRLTSPGPAIFAQYRYGKDNKPFRIYKFRTLYADRGDPDGTNQTEKGDVRVTPIGAVLRKWSIDELPQLWNVLRGDMSLVGPRPHPIGMFAGGRLYEDFVPLYPLRHVIRPGLTGRAQVNGLRGETKNPDLARARIAHDIAYIGSLSVLQDLSILGKTIGRELNGGTGY